MPQRAERPPVPRHVFLCCDTREEGCASAKAMRRAWKQLKERLRESGASDVLATRSRCFGICRNGPVAVVYPDGVWYGGCDEAAIDRIVEDHLEHGRVVAELEIRPFKGR